MASCCWCGHVKRKWVREAPLSDGLETGCRYFICLLMLVYRTGGEGFHGQFYTDEYWKDTPLGSPSRDAAGLVVLQLLADHTRRSWAQLKSSSALLILFKRTTGLGIVLFLPVMANLVLINIIYQVGALPSAVPLLLAGLILLFLSHFQKPETLRLPGRRRRISRSGG